LLALDHVPPTVLDQALLALLGQVLETTPTPLSTEELRLRFFQPSFSWQALVDFAVAHEVLQPLIYSLQQRSLLPPLPLTSREELRSAHVTSRLVAAQRQHLERQADLREQLQATLAALNTEGIIPLLLKGAVHLTKQGDWHEAREMRDLDIMVRIEKADEANRILSSLGYRPDYDPPPLDRHLPELWCPGRAGTIEIHTEALSFNARRAFTTVEVWDLAGEHSFDGANFMALPAEWHLLHGLLHHQLADRGHARRMLALKGLWEFARVGAELSPQAWYTIIAHAEQRHILAMLSNWAVQANRLFGLEAPAILLRFEAGRRHADATFKRARMRYGARQALFLADKLRFAFAPGTLAVRYGASSAGAAALRHIGFLWSRRRQMARRWFGR
jgi:hypothetical protein